MTKKEWDEEMGINLDEILGMPEESPFATLLWEWLENDRKHQKSEMLKRLPSVISEAFNKW